MYFTGNCTIYMYMKSTGFIREMGLGPGTVHAQPASPAQCGRRGWSILLDLLVDTFFIVSDVCSGPSSPWLPLAQELDDIWGVRV